MDYRTGGRRAQNEIHSYSNHSRNAPRHRANYPPEEIDRYNTVDRDIYSDSRASRAGGGGRRKRRRGCGGKVLAFLLSVLLLAALTGIAYSAVMFSRLNRSDNVNSEKMAQYVQQPSGAPTWDVKSDGNVMNILLLGIDENDDGTDGRSDSDLLVSINTKNKTLHMVSFLRDTYLEIPTVGKNKLNSAYANGGVALTMQTLANNYRVSIDKYVSVDFKSFTKVIDQMGGLDVKMSAAACRAENENMGSHLKPGVNHLDGRLCLYYTRIRHATDSFGHDDYGRAGRQRQVVELIIQKMKSMNPVAISKLMYEFLPDVKTNLSDAELVKLTSVGTSISGYKTASKQIPAPNTFTEPYVKGIGDVVKPNLEKNSAILRSFLYGDTVSPSD